MSHSSFIGYWISWEARSKCNIKIGKNPSMNPYTRTCVTCFFCWIIVGLIWFWTIEIGWKLVMSSLDLLHKNNIRIIALNEILNLSFFLYSPKSVYIPSYDTHNYSTVTDLARFLGLSTSRPKKFAIWYAKSWRMTTSRKGFNSEMSGSNSMTSV